MKKIILAIFLLFSNYCFFSCDNTEKIPENQAYELDISEPEDANVVYMGTQSRPENKKEQFHNERRLVRRGTYWGYIRIDSTLIIDCVYEEATIFKNGFASVQKNQKKGIIDVKGAEILPLQFDKLLILSKYKVAIVKQNDKWDLVDFNNKSCLKEAVDSLAYRTDSSLVSIKNKQHQLIDYTGKTLTKRSYDWIGRFVVGRAPIYADSLVGFIDEKGIDVIPLQYNKFQKFNEDGMAAVAKDNRWGIIDRLGRIKLELKYDEVYDLWIDGHFTVEQNGTKKCVRSIDIRNGIAPQILDLDYDNIECFEKGVVMVTKDKKNGALNEKGKLVIPLEYATLFSTEMRGLEVNANWGNYLIGHKNKKEGVIDKANNVIFPFKYNFIKALSNNIGYLKVRQGLNHYGVTDLQGNLVIPIQNRSIYGRPGGYLFIVENDFWGILSLATKEVVVPAQYFKVKQDENDLNLFFAYKDSTEITIDTFRIQ
ncbi:MAG: Unknown protein [uncultured Aureispira sp.]|uniref:WG repeat-containing protein n=1 Tax=uncultured Aureispira sp. TaxID=1331704 RepID=A0A6S6TK38_9BACT|nr:MAG: Unknown protein [uncultured Aureispira sp.]